MDGDIPPIPEDLRSILIQFAEETLSLAQTLSEVVDRHRAYKERVDPDSSGWGCEGSQLKSAPRPSGRLKIREIGKASGRGAVPGGR